MKYTDAKLRETLARNVRGRMAVVLRDYDGDHVAILARRAGCSRSTIQRILAAQAAPTVDTLSSLAKALGVTPWLLLVDSLDPEHPQQLRALTDRQRQLLDLAGG